MSNRHFTIKQEYTVITKGEYQSKQTVYVDMKGVLQSLLARWNKLGYNGTYTYHVSAMQIASNLKARPIEIKDELVYSSAIDYIRT